MSAERNKALVRRFLAAHAKGDLDTVEGMLAPDFVDRNLIPGQQPGREVYLQALTEFHTTYSHTHYDIEKQLAEADEVVTTFAVSSTHDRGEWMGLVPTGKEFKALQTLIHRIVGDKITEEWSPGSNLGELAQQSLEQERIERERIEQELKVARSIQQASLPEKVPDLEGYKTETEEHPREEWIPISVPDSGIPSETIQRARKRIEGNTWTPSNNNGLTWELSGGVGLCGYCGSRLRTRSPNNSTRKYFYYTCLNESCAFNKHYRKQELERRVGELLADTLRPDTWTEFVEKTINQKIADLKRRHRSPTESRQRLLEWIGQLQAKLDRTRELYTDGDYLKEEYHEKRDAIQDQILVVRQDLSNLEDVNTGMTRIAFLRHLLMSMTRGVDQTYFGFAGTARGEDKRHLVVTAYPDHPTFFTSSGESSMVERQEFYRKMNLLVRVHDDDLELEIATPAISQSEDPS